MVSTVSNTHNYIQVYLMFILFAYVVIVRNIAEGKYNHS